VPSGTPDVPSRNEFSGPPNVNRTTLEIWVQPRPIRFNGTLCNVIQTPSRQRVFYFVSEHGDAIINGDQIYGTEAELPAAAVHDDDVPRKRSVSVSPVSSVKWPNGEILYKWDPALDNARKDIFLKATKVWTDRLPSIRFTLSND
jgi:hypothetical protein